jgi:hypothetical protein
MENADEQGNQAATRSEGPEVSDPAEPREGYRKSRPLGEQSGLAAPQIRDEPPVLLNTRAPHPGETQVQFRDHMVERKPRPDRPTG